MQSLAAKLRNDLDDILGLIADLLNASTINWKDHRARRFANETGVFVMGMSDGAWGPLDDAQRLIQRRILERWEPWSELTDLLFTKDTKETRRHIKDAKKSLMAWVERTDTWSIPKTIPEAQKKVRERAQPLYAAFQRLEDAEGRLVAVPDTNVLLSNPQLPSYAATLGEEAFHVVLVPSVLRELDGHKVNHRNPEVREKARKFSGRIKGWRNQGDLAAGVRVQGDVWVRVEGREPDFENTLSWLQKDIEDDRILASILEIQRTHPGDTVILLTGDTVMLAKADAARVPAVDPSEPGD